MTLLIWLGALGVLCVAVASYAPKSVPATDLPSHFVLQAAIGAALLLCAAVAFGVQGRVYLVLLLAYFLCVGRMWPFLLKARAEEGRGAVLKILQANVWVRNRKTAPLKEMILGAQPDIVILAEVNAAFAEMLEGLRDGWPHQHILARDDSRGGIGVLSKAPLEGLEVKHLASPDIPSLFFRTVAGGREVGVVALHAANPLRDLRARDAEFEALAAWFDREQPPRLIVAGDLNATPYCPALRRMMRRLRLRNARDGRGFFGSFPVRTLLPFLRLPIDHVLVGGPLKTDGFRLGASIGSDHLPTLTVIRLPD